MRRVGRWLLRIVLGLVALIVVVLAVVTVALHTSAGRGLVRDLTESILADVFVRPVHIGSIEKLWLDGAVLRDVVLTDSHDRRAIAVEQVSVELSPWALLDQRVQVDRVQVEKPRVLMVSEADGTLNLAKLVKTSSTPPAPSDGEPLGWVIAVASASVAHAHVEYHTPTSSMAVDRIALAATATIAIPRITVRGLALDAEGRPAVRGGRLDLDLDSGALDARAKAILDRALVEKLAQLPGLRGNARLDVVAARRSETAPWYFGVRGTVARAPLALSATVAADFSHGQVSGHADGIDPSQLYSSAPGGTVSWKLDGELRGLEPLNASVELEARGRLAPGPDPRKPAPFDLRASGEAQAGALSARVDLTGLGAKLGARAHGRTSTSSFVIDDARVTVRAPDLNALAMGLVPLGGALTATVTARGPVDALDLTMDVRGKRTSVADVHIKDLKLTGAVTGVPSRIGGKVDLSATVLRLGEVPMGDLSLKANAVDNVIRADLGLGKGRYLRSLAAKVRVERDGADTWIFLPTLDAITRTSRWRITDARARLAGDGGIDVHRVVLRSQKGNIAIDAELDQDVLGGPGFVNAELEALQLDTLRQDFGPTWPHVNGLLDAKVALRTGPAESARVTVAVEDLRYPGVAGSIRSQLGVRLDRGVATASVAVKGVEVGELRLDGRVRIPGKSALAGDTWARWDGRGVEIFDVKADDLDLGRLGLLFPEAGFLAGKLDLTMSSSRDLSVVIADVDAREVRHRKLPGPITAKVGLRADGKETNLTAAAGIGDQPLAALMAHVAASAREWLKMPATVLEKRDAQVDLALDGFPVALMEDFAPEPPGVQVAPRKPILGGEVTVRAKIDRTKGKYRGTIDGEGLDLKWVEKAPPVTATIAIALNETGLTAAGGMHGKGLGSLALRGRGRAPADITDGAAWKALGVKALERLTIETQSLDLGEVDRITDHRVPLRGTVTTRIVAHEALERVEVALRASSFGRRDGDLRTDAAVFIGAAPAESKLEMTLYQQARPILTATASAPVGPAKLATGKVDFDALPLHARAQLEELPLALVAELLALGVPMGGTLTGTVALDGSVKDYHAGAYIDASKAQVKDQSFDKFIVDATLDTKALQAKAIAREKNGAGTLDLDAKVDLAGGGVVDADLRAARFRLDFLSAFFQRQRSIGGITGALDASVRLQGTAERPSGKGNITLSGLGVVLSSPIPPIERTRVDLVLADRDITAHIEGHSGEGDIKGQVKAKLETVTTPSFEVNLTTDDVPLIAGPRKALIDADVTVKGTLKDGLDAEVTIASASVEVPNASGESYKVVRDLSDVVYVDEQRRDAVMGPAGAAKKPEKPMKVTVKTKKDIPVRGSEIAATAAVDLAINGAETSGKVSVGDGWLTLFGKRWTIQRAEIQLLGTDEPRVNVEITRDVGSAVAVVRVRGTVREPELELTSDPPIFDEAQVLMFVLGADPGSGDEAASLEERAAGAAVGALVGALRSKLEDELPIDTIDVEVAEGAKIARLTVGKWITGRVFLGYEYVFEADDDENSNEGIVQVRLGRGWILESRYGDRGAGGVDIMWVNRF